MCVGCRPRALEMRCSTVEADRISHPWARVSSGQFRPGPPRAVGERFVGRQRQRQHFSKTRTVPVRRQLERCGLGTDKGGACQHDRQDGQGFTHGGQTIASRAGRMGGPCAYGVVNARHLHQSLQLILMCCNGLSALSSVWMWSRCGSHPRISGSTRQSSRGGQPGLRWHRGAGGPPGHASLRSA